MRYRFDEVFKINPNGSINPVRAIRLGGVSLGPSVSFSKGVSFSGLDIFNFLWADIEAEEIDGILVIQGFYRKVQDE